MFAFIKLTEPSSTVNVFRSICSVTLPNASHEFYGLFSELRAAFNEFDPDKCGEIEASSVAMVVRTLGMDFRSLDLQKAMKRASGVRGENGDKRVMIIIRRL